jgi:putative glutamine amidotransferase
VTRARPLIVIPGRFSASASALRYAAVVTARALAEAVWAAGGEPLTVLPGDDAGPDRFRYAEGILLPGGGDLSPTAYGQDVASGEVYDVDATQDAADLALARWSAAGPVPLLAVCRGMQVLNVALGGTLAQHMAAAHRHTVRRLDVRTGSRLAGWLGTEQLDISCYHHQRIDRLAPGLQSVAVAGDGTVEAVELAGRAGFAVGVQWHPEDTAAIDAANAALFTSFVAAAARAELSAS